MESTPVIKYKDGYLRVVLPSGETLPETNLKIEDQCGDRNQCLVTVSFIANLDLK